ncbi:Regulator of G-protein signaling rgs-3 [Frankliniella fusca]|uniref:Regulator of G-protein signaling rgs-3 n=1 Tax=Frankliniella fusca TaxID=407009 RepID=A0AAE1GTM4_9NEOP|nr:Regulator of G-protein signaling rgs-3 [Frankliniella fusca]
MNCVPCLECGDGYSITRENLDRWTDSVGNVLASTDGRHHFKRYLESRSLDESLSTVEFWERCVRIMPTKSEGGDSPPPPSSSEQPLFSFAVSSQGQSSSSSTSHHRFNVRSSLSTKTAPVSENLHRELELLVEFADNYVNLDLAQMRNLYRMVRLTEESKVIEALLQAKQSAMELLADDYELFKEHLLKSQGLLKR